MEGPTHVPRIDGGVGQVNLVPVVERREKVVCSKPPDCLKPNPDTKTPLISDLRAENLGENAGTGEAFVHADSENTEPLEEVEDRSVGVDKVALLGPCEDNSIPHVESDSGFAPAFNIGACSSGQRKKVNVRRKMKAGDQGKSNLLGVDAGGSVQ
ncbi:unnamed protein product [Amaranthus hypochondriacus]